MVETIWFFNNNFPWMNHFYNLVLDFITFIFTARVSDPMLPLTALTPSSCDCAETHVFMHDCASVRACYYIITSPCWISVRVICSFYGNRWEYGQADAGLFQPSWHQMTFPSFHRPGPVPRYTISHPSISLKPFCHTTHIECCMKRWYPCFFLTPRKWQWSDGNNYRARFHLSPRCVSLKWKEAPTVCFFHSDMTSLCFSHFYHHRSSLFTSRKLLSPVPVLIN